MYYEEKWIDRVLCWRSSPDGEWTAYTLYELGQRYQAESKRRYEHEATIADLQGQVKRLDATLADVYAQRDGLQQRVAQLEGELKRYAGCGHDHSTAWWQLRCEDMENDKVILQRHLQESAEQLGKLQADHASCARVLGLLAQVTEIADMMLKGTECEHDVGLCSCEHRRIVKQAQRSLPAQPAQGGAHG